MFDYDLDLCVWERVCTYVYVYLYSSSLRRIVFLRNLQMRCYDSSFLNDSKLRADASYHRITKKAVSS